jgi:hypothetical protein
MVQVPLAWNINASLTRAAVLLPFTWMGWFTTRWCSWSRKTLRGMQYSFKEQTEFTILTKLLDPLVSNIKDPLTNLQFFSHLLVCGNFPQSWCSSPMKTLTVRQRSFQNITQFTKLNKVQGPLAYSINASLTRAALFSHSLEWGHSAERCYCSPRKTLRSTQYSFKEQTEFTIITMLLDPLLSNIKDSLSNLQFFSIYLCAVIFHKVDVPHPWKRWQVGCIPFKMSLSSPCLTRCKGLLLVTLMLLLQELQCSPVHLNGVIQQKGDIAHPRKHWEVRSTPLKGKLNSQ